MWGIVSMFIALVAVWFVVDACRRPPAPTPNAVPLPALGPAEAAWNSPHVKPPRGRYTTRVPGKAFTESHATYFNGDRWLYLDGFECYVQEREWRELPSSSAAEVGA